MVPTVCLYEVFKTLLTNRGEDAASTAAAAMNAGRVGELTASIALFAARVDFHHKIPFVDGIILATARTYGARGHTQDVRFWGVSDVELFE